MTSGFWMDGGVINCERDMLIGMSLGHACRDSYSNLALESGVSKI